MTTERIDGVSLTTKANVYFDGKCISHSYQLADGTKQSVGVVLPATLTFGTAAAEIMETDRRFNRMRPSIAPRKRHQAG